MKIEIELEEIERLKNENEDLRQTVNKYYTQLKELNEKNLTDKAFNLAQRLFNAYMSCVFRKLGFELWQSEAVNFNNIDHRKLLKENKRWFENDDLITIDIELFVSSQFKQAFLRIATLPDVEFEEKIQKEDEFKIDMKN